MKKRFLALILSLVLCLSLVPAGAYATYTVTSGFAGDNATFTLDSSGTLTITGTGQVCFEYYYKNSSDDTTYNDIRDYSDDVRSVIIGEGMTSIGEEAFECFTNLTSVSFPSTLTEIGDWAFCADENLTSVTLPQNLWFIGDEAFEDTGLKTITIPASVTWIGEEAFFSFDLQRYSVDSGNPNYCAVNGVLFSKDKTELVSYPMGKSGESYTIPDGVETIDSLAFWDTNLKNVTIPESVTAIRDRAFLYSSLTSLTIPKSVTSIGERAFAFCSSLTAFTVATGNPAFCAVDGVLFSADQSELIAYPAGSSRTSYTIPAYVNYLWLCAFSDVENLKTIAIPDSVETVDDYTFDECWSLQYLVFPGSVQYYGDECVVSDCYSLRGISFENGYTYIGNFVGYNENLSAIGYPATVQEIWNEWDWAIDEVENIYFAGSRAQWQNVIVETYQDGTTIFDDASMHFNSAYSPCTGHTVVTDPAVPATCSTLGLTAGTHCSVCGKVLTQQQVIPKLTHNIVTDPAVSATCTTDGKTEGSHCSICGTVITAQNTISASGHSWDNGTVTTAATCTKDGVKTYTCSVCKATKTETIPALGHNYVNGVCTRCGAADSSYHEHQYVNGKCSVCGAVYSGTSMAMTDVAAGSFCYDAVLYAANHDPVITAGKTATTFCPKDTCTRGQVVTFLWRSAGCPNPKSTNNPFTDVSSSAYYYKAVLWAVEQGITSGYSDGTFRPNAGCTRGQVVTFLWRFAGQPEPSGTTNPFVDVASNAYYYKAVLWAGERNITAGMTATEFKPNNTCNRGQIVTFLYRYAGTPAVTYA